MDTIKNTAILGMLATTMAPTVRATVFIAAACDLHTVCTNDLAIGKDAPFLGRFMVSS